jgi:flagellar assembly protein FliH
VRDSDFTPIPVPRLGETPLDLRGAAERARTRGYADGYAQGLAAAGRRAEEREAEERERMRRSEAAYLQERAVALTALRAARDALDERVAEVSLLSARRVEELAIELAESILQAELADPARSAAHALRRALAHAPISRWVRVAFDEDDLRLLRTESDAAQILRDIELIADPGVGAGGAVVEFDAGAVDTRIADALERATAALRGEDEQSMVGSAA